MSRLPRGGRAIAWAGVLTGVLAGLIALPPIEIRSAAAPVVVGLAALTGRGSAASVASAPMRSRRACSGS